MEALGTTRDELVRQWSSELETSVEELLEAFLKDREPKA
jgi:hypothetical protein